MGTLWINFAAVVAGQAVLFFALARIRGFAIRRSLRVLGLSLILGLPIGLIFDSAIDRGALIFQYYLGQDINFLVINGLLSYGFAVATGGTFPSEMLRRRKGRLSRSDLALILMIAALIGVGSIALRRSGPFLEMFWAGTIVIAFGEAVALLGGWLGPIARLCQGELKPPLILWINGIALGIIYEVLNLAFPVWHWTLSNSMPGWSVELFVIVFGYFVLFHPIALGWQILLHKPIQGRTEKLMKRYNQLYRISKHDDG